MILSRTEMDRRPICLVTNLADMSTFGGLFLYAFRQHMLLRSARPQEREFSFSKLCNNFMLRMAGDRSESVFSLCFYRAARTTQIMEIGLYPEYFLN